MGDPVVKLKFQAEAFVEAIDSMRNKVELMIIEIMTKLERQKIINISKEDN